MNNKDYSYLGENKNNKKTTRKQQENNKKTTRKQTLYKRRTADLQFID